MKVNQLQINPETEFPNEMNLISLRVTGDNQSFQFFINQLTIFKGNSKSEIIIGFGHKLFEEIKDLEYGITTELNFYKFRKPKFGEILTTGSRLKYSNTCSTSLFDAGVIIWIRDKSKLDLSITTEKLCNLVEELSGVDVLNVINGFNDPSKKILMGFEDGTSNIDLYNERISAIENEPLKKDSWMAGGTYLVSILFSIDLSKWEQLSTEKQEKIIGRKKRSNELLENIEDSHVSLNRNHKYPPSDRRSLRIFRQGYNLAYFDKGKYITGLSFNSFQESPYRTFESLSSGQWLGGKVFGGDDEIMSEIISVIDSGVFAIPPLLIFNYNNQLKSQLW